MKFCMKELSPFFHPRSDFEYFMETAVECMTEPYDSCLAHSL
jgi:hypothetical protein